MIGEKLGHFLDGPLKPLAGALRVDPNLLTVAGLLITALAGYVLGHNLRIGAVLVLAGGAFDVLDGMVARANGRETPFGAYLDSLLDRYSDAFIFLGVGWHMLRAGDTAGVLLSLGTMVGAFGVSYARARAEGLGLQCKTGLMERPERVVLVVVGAFTGYMVEVLWAMFFLTHLTVLQRVLHVWKSLTNKE